MSMENVALGAVTALQLSRKRRKMQAYRWYLFWIERFMRMIGDVV